MEAIIFRAISLQKKLPFLLFLFISAKSQTASVPNDQDFIPSPADSVTAFQPSLPVVVGMLSIMLSLTFILLLYAKLCHSHSASPHDDRQAPLPLPWRRSDAAGMDKTLIESLPSFRFSLLRGSREGLECAVCLSKFVDVEILRLLPKCKHAFHVDCIDQWLCKRSSCPLCRQKVGKNDLSQMPYSDSFRFLWDRSDRSGFELYVEREAEERRKKFGSSRFSLGGSFREAAPEIIPIQETAMDLEDQNKKSFHKFKHKIILTDQDPEPGVFKNRWSNVGSSDIMSLNSEMIGRESSSRFSRSDSRRIEMEGNKFDQGIVPTDRDRATDLFKNRWSNIGSSDIMFLNSEMIGHESSSRFPCSDSRRREESVGSKHEVVANKFDHRIDLTDHDQAALFKNRWSNVGSSDIMFLNSEMIGHESSSRFSCLDSERRAECFRSKEKIQEKSAFESKSKQNESCIGWDSNGKRSMSEITLHPRRLPDLRIGNRDERMRRMWLPIARNTINWLANREEREALQHI